jgi:hypothetical protein
MIIYPKPFTVTLMYHRAVIWGLFTIADINKVLFEPANILGYAWVETVEDCHWFLDRLNEWYLVNKFYLNAGKCKALSFLRNINE